MKMQKTAVPLNLTIMVDVINLFRVNLQTLFVSWIFSEDREEHVYNREILLKRKAQYC
jgi:hypothetical protein